MSYPSPLDVGRGVARGLSKIIKHGNNHGVGTSYEPVTSDGNLMLPPPSGAQQLRAVSTSTDDTASGTGGRSIILIGLDASGDEITETIILNGTTQSALTVQAFWRLNFADLLESGVYGTTSTGSHVGTITISDQTSAVWAQIRVNGYPHGRWQSSWYSVPNGYVAYSNGYRVGVESNKQANIKILARRDALRETAPYSPIQELTELTGVSGNIDVDLPYVFGPIPAGTDIGAVAQMTATTGRVSFDLDLVLERKNG